MQVGWDAVTHLVPVLGVGDALRIGAHVLEVAVEPTFAVVVVALGVIVVRHRQLATLRFRVRDHLHDVKPRKLTSRMKDPTLCLYRYASASVLSVHS